MTVSILVVDDEPDVVDLFQRRFRKELRAGDFTLHFAKSGEEALRQLQTGVEPELMLILSDINMPGMSGLELLECVKYRLPHLPVGMITAYGDPENRRRAIQAGASDFVIKPINFNELKAKIATLLASRSGS